MIIHIQRRCNSTHILIDLVHNGSEYEIEDVHGRAFSILISENACGLAKGFGKRLFCLSEEGAPPGELSARTCPEAAGNHSPGRVLQQ